MLKKEGTGLELYKLFVSRLHNTMKGHVWRVTHQLKALKQGKNATNEDAVLVMDFSKNYACNYAKMPHAVITFWDFTAECYPSH